MTEYWHYLAVVSLFFVVLERLAPWHRPHATLRRGWLRDLCFLAVNGHLFTFFAGIYLAVVYTGVVAKLQDWGCTVEQSVALECPLWVQFLAFFVLSDLVQWATHIALHRIPFLWAFHKVHHSIPRLDWAANFHFHWMEILVYKTTQALPLAWLGASTDVTFWVYVAGTFWGHFNHSNVPIGIGPLKYVFNSPRMHIWHHDASDEGGIAKNFGIVLSLWDWIFGTVYWPEGREPKRLGYPGDEEMPQHLGGQMVWPLSRAFQQLRRIGVGSRTAGF